MDAIGQHLDAQFSADQAAQRRGRPESLIVAASRVERDTQTRLPDPLGEMLYIVRQIETAALLARLDNHDASRMRNRLRLQRSDCAEAREHRVTVVGAAASIKTLAIEHRLPRAETRAPAR